VAAPSPSAGPGPAGQPPYGPPAQPGGYPPYPAGGPGQPPFQAPYPTYQQPGYGYGYGAKLPTHSTASTALTLGIVGLVGGFFCGAPILASPVAWFMGSQAIREIDAAPGQWGGRDYARAGQVLGIIGTALLVLAVMAVVVLIVALGSVDPGLG
jgi:hypothetical protein